MKLEMLNVADLKEYPANPRHIPQNATANLNHIDKNGVIQFTQKQIQPGSGHCFKALGQNSLTSNYLKKATYAEAMNIILHARSFRDIMGLAQPVRPSSR